MRRIAIPLSLSLLMSATCALAASQLDALGLKPGTAYPRARSELQKQGWRIDAQEPEEASDFRDAPEVVCGHGRDAVCTARFLKAGRAIMLTLKPVDGRLLLEGAEADD